MPDTRPGIVFNEQGVCSACVHHEKKKEINWEERMSELKKICDMYRKPSGFDCMIAVSSGKDSHYQVHMFKEKMRMHPLLVSVTDNFSHTKAGEHNLKNLSREFGCEIIIYSPNIRDQKIVMDYTFRRYGKPTWYVDRLIYTYPLHMAVNFKIPLLIFGENISYEYGGIDDIETPSARNQVENGVASDIDLTHLDVDKTFLRPPPARDLTTLDPIYLSYFVPWNSYQNYLFAKSRGFRDLSQEWDRTDHVENFDQVDSIAYLVHPWMKYPKFGHAMDTDYLSKFIRYGLMTREQAVQKLNTMNRMVDPLAMRDLCDFMGYTDAEFWSIVESHWNRDLFEKDQNGEWKLKYQVV